MAEESPDRDRIDHETRIRQLKKRARELTNGQISEFEAEGADDPQSRAMREVFWEHVVEVEEGGWTSMRQQLRERGVDLPTPQGLSDEQLAARLAELIGHLAALRTYLHNTDHLSDRELYAALWHEVLDEEVPLRFAGADEGKQIIDMVGSGSEEDIHLYMKYYADDEERWRWQADWPEDDMPSKQTPPYDRDRHLPGAPRDLQGRRAQPEGKPANLDKIVECMEWHGDGTFCYYDRATGQVECVLEEHLRKAENEEPEAESPWPERGWEREAMELPRAVLDDPGDRFVPLPEPFDVDEWDMMRTFAQEVSDDALSRRLLDANHGKGAFRRFRVVVHEAGVETRWFACRDRAYREIAEEWCREHNIPVKPESPDNS